MKSIPLLISFFLMLKGCSSIQNQSLIKGKLVYRSCATIAVQVLDSSYFHLGQPEWEAGKGTGKTYTHVFAVANNCAFPEGMAIGQEFSFVVLKDDPANKECMVCEIYDYPPQVKRFIKVGK